MAARVLLLSILFTEVLTPVCCAGIKGVGSGVNGRNGPKQDSLEPGPLRNLDLSLQIEPKEDVILGKKGITISCNVNPNQDIFWLHNGVKVPPCGISRCTFLRNGALQFYKKKNLEVTPKRKGWNNSSKVPVKDEYRCVVRTNFGGYLRSSPVAVRLAKLSRTFKQQPKDVKVYEGEVARLSCLIDSVPLPPKITWEHNSVPLSFDQDNKKYTFVPPGVLYISATKLSDAGSYRCIAANNYLNKTTTSNDAILTVISKSTNEHSISSLLPQPSYKHVLTKKSSLRLVCAVSGYPPSVTTWSFISRNPNNKTGPVFLIDSTAGISVLDLENVGPSDSGFYICSAKNSYNGSMEYQNVTVDVFIPPTFLKKPTSQVCPNGRTARFECQAQGYPQPRIYWLKDAENVTVNGRRTIYEKGLNKVELAISATVSSDSGVYQCVAVSEAGEIWAAGRLQVNTSRNSPDAPTALKCHALSPKRIYISWEPPKYLPSTNITAYTVHYSPIEGGKEEVSPPELGNVTSVEVSKLLEPFTNYSFYVRLYNNHGASDQSTVITCSTAPSVPKSAPKINLNVISSSKLNVTWIPLNKRQAQGVIVQYKLQWRLHQHPSSWILYFPPTVENHILTDLTPEAQYDVRVLARTEQGWPTTSESQLPWSTITMPPPETGQFTIKNLVDVSLTYINASVVSMKWAVNEKSNQNLGHEYHAWQVCSENQKGEKLETRLLPKNVTEYLFTNLDANNSYTVGLCMITLKEARNCLNKRIESAGRSLSNIPTALEAVPASANSINLTWSIADTYHDSVFEVCYHAVHIMKDTSNCVFVNGTMATIEDLKPFTLYQFKIRVLPDEPYENNEFSQAIECYTCEDIPGKVEDVHWFLGNSTLIRLAWKEPTRINGIIQKYFIVYTMDLSNSDLWENITVPGNKTTTSLPGLVSGRRYFVMVQAATKAGNGKPSDPIIIVAGGSPSKNPTLSGEQKPSPNVKPDQSLGVILGLSISVICIGVCLCSMYCRRRWETSRSLRDTPQPLKSRGFVRNGNGCCIDRSSTSVSQHVPHNPVNEIELSILCPPTTNPHVDTKGSQPNGIFESGAKEPLLNPWNSNGDSKDLRITENPQCKARVSSTSSKQQEHDLDDTQLTMVNCTLRSSTSSLNNNGGLASIASSEKIVSNFLPVLEPNG